MADKKNYYEILGVKKDATEDEIKAAYKKLVKQYHPDLHPGDKLAAEKFKEINEANEVLSDKQKRAAYDYEQEHPGMGGPGGMGGGFSGFGGFEDIFGSIFQGFGGGASMQRDTRGEDIELNMTLSFMDAAKGCRKDITYMRNEPCRACGGTGAKDGTAFKTCDACGGKGQVKFTQETIFGRTVRVGACNRCGGRGKIVTEKCPECKGKGYLRRETTVTLDIPAGADTNSYMKRRGYGQASAEGGEAGDLIVVFRVEPHKIFRRKNMDLYVDLPIPFATPSTESSLRSIAPASAVTSPSLATSIGISCPSSSLSFFATSMYMVLTRFSKSSLETFRNSDATMILLSIYTPAEETPIASTRGICAAAVFIAV